MTDYVIKFSGQDNLSGTINSIKTELQEVGKNTTALDEISKKFQRIQNSSAPLKRKLRDLQAIMAQMNLNGLNNTEVFNQIAAQAGTYKDAVADAAAATRLLSSDTAKLDAGINALQGLAGAATIATGVMGLLGTKNEEVQQTILKVQSAMAILNGVQSVANALNKDSILMLTVKQVQSKAAAAATTLEANATKGATVAQAAFNLVAKANPYVLLATAAIAAGAAIYAFTQKTDEATESQKRLEEETDNYKEAQDSQNSTLAESIIKFEELQRQWVSLGDDLKAKKRFVDDNSTAFNSLGLEVNSVTDAEKVFGKNANAIIAAMRARARAAAAHAMCVRNLTEMYQQLSQVEAKLKKGESFSKSELAEIGILNPDKMAGLVQDFNIGNFLGLKEDSFKVIGKNAADQIINSATVTLQARADELNKPFEKIADEAQAEVDSTPFITSTTRTTKKSGKSGSSRSSRNSKTTSPKPEPVFKEDAATLKEMKDNVAVLQKRLEGLNVDSDQFKEVSAELERWQLLIKHAGETLSENKFKLDADSLIPTAASFLKQKPIEIPVTIAPIKTQIEGARDLAQRAEEVINQTLQDYDTGIIGYQKAKDLIDGINQILVNKGLKPIKVEIIPEYQKAFEDFKMEALSVTSAFDGINSVVSSFTSLNESIKEGANAWEIFMGVVSLVGQTLNSVSSVMEAVNTVTELLGVTTAATSATSTAAAQQEVANSIATTGAKSGEAIAEATASGAGLPFPINLVAIAAGVAAVLAALASISGAFADGGIVGGASPSGDHLLARVNSGEMILNGRQQKNLFNLLDRGDSHVSSTSQVEFKISGSTLKGVLRNYDNKMSKLK